MQEQALGVFLRSMRNVSQMPHVPSGNAQLANQRLEPDIGIFSVFRRQRRIPVPPKGKRSSQEPEQLF